MPHEQEWFVDCIASIHHVRQALTEALADHPRRMAGDVELCASELLTNALTHGQPPARLRLRFEPSGIRVEVHDREASLLPRFRSPGPEGGFGLRIVDSLATGWGCRQEPIGKTVWADFHRQADQPPRAESP